MACNRDSCTGLMPISDMRTSSEIRCKTKVFQDNIKLSKSHTLDILTYSLKTLLSLCHLISRLDK